MTEELSDFDATDLDMIRRGDMLGPKLGQRVYDALSRPLNDIGTVKPLEWIEHQREEWHANSIVGQYSVGLIGERWTFILRRISGDNLYDERFTWLASEAEAKAAAQADYASRILSALVPSPPTGEVAEGFVLVPREPTREMMDGGTDAYEAAWPDQYSAIGIRNAYRAMLAAAPSPTPQPDSQGDGWQDISSAPRNGEEFLAADFSGALGDNFQQVVSWTEWTDSAGRQCAGWDIADGATRPPSCFTHWRPLPVPPAIQQGA
jgi:hypothetical protein